MLRFFFPSQTRCQLLQRLVNKFETVFAYTSDSSLLTLAQKSTWLKITFVHNACVIQRLDGSAGETPLINYYFTINHKEWRKFLLNWAERRLNNRSTHGFFHFFSSISCTLFLLLRWIPFNQLSISIRTERAFFSISMFDLSCWKMNKAKFRHTPNVPIIRLACGFFHLVNFDLFIEKNHAYKKLQRFYSFRNWD